MQDADGQELLLPPAPLAFVGLGRMGLPMAARLTEAGYAVTGVDLAVKAREAFAQVGGRAVEALREPVRAIVTMLPEGAAVRAALLEGGALACLQPGGLVIDMSSSAPVETRALGEELAARDAVLLDAPVSGGVRRALDGSLAIMAGGPAAAMARVRPLLQCMGSQVFETGPLGSGHAMKALNNYVSAAGLLAAAEALAAAERFGLSPDKVVAVLNASTGRNNATENKLAQFVLSGSFGSGFSLALMAKDLRNAADLVEHLGLPSGYAAATAAVWEAAQAKLTAGADHTEIARFVQSPEDAGAG